MIETTAKNRRSVHLKIGTESRKVLDKSPTRTRAYVMHITSGGGTVWLYERQHTAAVGGDGIPLAYGETAEVLDKDELWALCADSATLAITELTN